MEYTHFQIAFNDPAGAVYVEHLYLLYAFDEGGFKDYQEVMTCGHFYTYRQECFPHGVQSGSVPWDARCVWSGWIGPHAQIPFESPYSSKGIAL